MKCPKIIGFQRLERGTTGVYIFLNIVKKIAYVGQTTDISCRLVQHLKGIFGSSTGTNINMTDEFDKAFEVAFFPIDNYDNNIDILFDYETSLMCICRENNLSLYNGDKNHQKEDLNRQLLISGKKQGNKTWWEICQSERYLKSINPEKIYKEIKQKFYSWFEKAYSNSLSDVVKETEAQLIKLWEKRVQLFKDPANDFFWMNSDKKIHVPKLLTREDMKKCGIQAKSFIDLTQEVDLEYSIWCNFGLYGTQGPITILRTKQYDLNLNPDHPLCFWALKKWGPNYKKDQLSLQEQYKGPRLLFLQYTSSNGELELNKISFGMDMGQEGINEYHERMKQLQKENKAMFADGYKIGNNVKRFPDDMFPMFITKEDTSNKMAFQISSMYYIKEINTKEKLNKFKEYFTALFKTSENRPLNNVLWRQSCFLTKVTDIEKLRDYVRTIPTEETSEVKLLVAILEFPYIVDVCKNL